MKTRQRKKIIKKDWIKLGIDFINGNKINFEEALSWIDIKLLSGFESDDMSWIVYIGDDENKDYDQSIDYCPECAEKEVEKLVKAGEFKEDELEIYTDNSMEVDGCESCDICGIALDCSSLGTWIDQELDSCEDYGFDLRVLFNLVQAGASQIEYVKEDHRTKKLLLSFFKNGEYRKFLRKKNHSVNDKEKQGK